MMRYLAACAALVGAATATSASAAISAFWVNNPITPAAITESPALANMQSWSLMATTSSDWASAGLRVTLPAGQTFFHHAFGGNTHPNPALVPAFAGLAYDTYVSGPGDTGGAGGNPPSVLGDHPAGPQASFGGPADPRPGQFAVSWFNLTPDAPGTFEIARLTFPAGPVPTIFWEGDPPTLPNSSNTSQVNPTETVIIPQIPEPASLGLLAAAGLLAIRRRK